MTTSLIFLPLLLLLLTLWFSLCTAATDVINTTHTFRDGDTLVSSGGAFQLGFFSPGNSRRRYLGIWFNKIPDFTVVWVANRETPLSNSSAAVLKVVPPGILNLLAQTVNSIVWSSNSSSRAAQSPVAQLLDNGNFVIREADDDNPENYIWQSFNNPTDTLLAGMNLGYVTTGHENYLSSWKSNDDPGAGPYTYHLDPTGYPQAVLKKNSAVLARTGAWNGVGFSGLPGLRKNPLYTFQLHMEGSAVYYHYELLNNSTVTRFVMNQTGGAQRWAWIDRSQGWILYITAPTDNCDTYNQCRAHGICSVLNSPICGCLEKFVPRFPVAWAEADWAGGCVRRTPLYCPTDGFVKYSQMKFPDAKKSWFRTDLRLAECELMCQRNCSCTAYATLDVRNGGSGCLFWSGELLDIRQVYGDGQDIFIRMASSELAYSNKKKRGILIGSLSSLGGIILLGIVFCICQRKKICSKLKRAGMNKEENNEENSDVELFNLSKISKATEDFSLNNKLGEGGFGPVYRGTLEDGQEIAIKRLSKTSFQGLDEFKNEVMCIARLQHRNLVKLLGCCIRGDEKMLIYEYMPNKSLDLILFDETKRRLLDWPKRFHIIIGIARGLMYLHQDSRLRIIHRDLKVSNILLDIDMNPKISDFGMARIFGGNETEANTSRVVGTYGYMSPEYMTDGIISTKSDIYSFGVVVLEIVSGQRNRRFSHKDHQHNLLGHAWILHKDGKSLELVQDGIFESCSIFEVRRSIHVALLCVQAYPEDRPSMSSVVNMLENNVVLPQPRQPGFFMEGDNFFSNDNSLSTKASSKNEITISMLQPR